jgi:hypothetical protein
MDTVRREVDERSVGLYQQRWVAWPVAWSAVWVGALAALAAALVIGLIGLALGAHELVPPRRVVRVRDFGLGAAVFSVVGALLASELGAGWPARSPAYVARNRPCSMALSFGSSPCRSCSSSPRWVLGVFRGLVWRAGWDTFKGHTTERSSFSRSVGLIPLGGNRGDQAEVSGQGFSAGVDETTCPSRISKVRGCAGFGLPGV